ncbi:MAG: glycoside hydrolase [Phycisphaerae bacterium]|nr:glycoside hydrolase [Phycisphaerae bacterium]
MRSILVCRAPVVRAAVSVLCLVLGMASACRSMDTSSRAADRVSLAGPWRFALDRQDEGVAQQWFTRDLTDRIELPGALQQQGYGDPIGTDTPWVAKLIDVQWHTKEKYRPYTEPGKVLVPFFLQPERHYVGPAWYQRDFSIADKWQGRRIVLTLERAHWETQVWVDDRPAGGNRSLGAPHVYDLGTHLTPGQHRLTIRVDNRMIVDVGADAHSISDETQTCWNGIVGRIELAATSPVWLAQVQAHPKVATKSVLLKVRLGNATGQAGQGTLTAGGRSQPVTWGADGGQAQIEVSLGAEARLWDEFDPALHQVTVSLTAPGVDDSACVTFGLREVGTEGLYLTMNGKRFLARGVLECAVFPLTAYPPTDVDSWRRIIRICKDHGLNHMRFHSWCPPEAAFVAADELGFYLQPECGIWARAGTRLGYGDPADKWLYEETDAILDAYGNHPSFVFMAHGNEPSAKTEFLAAWVRYVKEKDPRRLYTSATGWGPTEENQYDAALAVGGRQGRRIRGDTGWRGADYREGIAPTKVPIIGHEIGQFCSYPNFDEIAKYTGALKPGNLMIFRDFARAGGILEQNRELAHASGKLQVLCYKEEIEAALRTRGQAGFQLLDLHDFPGQGTALVGVLDAFWDSKGYVTPAEYRRFCNTTVPLVRLARRVFTTAETLEADAEITHFGPAPLESASPYWRLVDAGGNVVACGDFPTLTIPLDSATPLGRLRIDFSKLDAPKEYRIVVGIEGTPFENDWLIWLYPSDVDVTAPQGVLVTTRLDDATKAELEKGATVVLFPERIGRAHPPVSFTPIFWNNQLFPNERRQTLGLLCDPKHPVLARFPTREHSDWQWEDIVRGSRAFDCAALPAEVRPLIRVIDDWNTGRKLALAFECRIGPGKLLVCGADLSKTGTRSPAARQLYSSLLAYVSGPGFQPGVTLTADQVQALLDQETPAKRAPQSDKPLTELTPDI